jgi:class 3 adenylate cyclase
MKAIIVDNSESLQARQITEYLNYIITYGSVMYLSFSFVDYLYMPDLTYQWFVYRIVVVLYGLSLIPVLRIFKSTKILSFSFVSLATIICGAMNIMIYQTGGYTSLYIPGVPMAATFLICTLRMTLIQNTTVSILAYGPTLIIILLSVPSSDYRHAIVTSSFLFVTTALTIVYTLSEQSYFRMVLQEKLVHKRQEVLTKSFPVQMRHLIKKGSLELSKKATLQKCLVGFIDVVSSTKISNCLTINEDWELKESLLNLAIEEAQKYDFLILNQLGDGLLFIHDPLAQDGWQRNLLPFFKSVRIGYRDLIETYSKSLNGISSGVKFGVTTGEVILGFIGREQSFYTVMGPTVNLAARLADTAKTNELVLSEDVSTSIFKTSNFENSKIEHASLKGFNSPIPIYRYFEPENETTLAA